MTLERLPYGLANLPADMPPASSNETRMPLTLASLSRMSGEVGLDGFPVAEVEGGGPAARANPDAGNLRTAFLSGLGVVRDAAAFDPIVFTTGNEIKPLQPGQPLRRHELDLDAESEHWRRWPPLQLDITRFNPKRGLPQRVVDLVNTHGLEDRVMEAVEDGRAMMEGANWYDTESIRKRFVARLGHNSGTAAFYDLMSFIAASSPGSDVGTNIRNGSRYFNKARRGEPIPEVEEDTPKPYGHRWAGLINRLARAVAEGSKFDPIRYPKISSFLENLTGNYQPVTADIHALRLPAMLARDANFLKREYREKLEKGEISMDDAVANPRYWRNPYPNEYPALEQFYKKIAGRANLTPAEAQAAAWLGGGIMTGLKSGKFKTFVDHFNDRIRRTAEKEGLTEDETWNGFIDGNIDLVSLDGQANALA